MIKNNTIFEYVNNKNVDVILVIDPPCTDFIIKSGSVAKIKVDNKSIELNTDNPIISLRHYNEAINIDICPSFSLFLSIDDIEEKIW